MDPKARRLEEERRRTAGTTIFTAKGLRYGVRKVRVSRKHRQEWIWWSDWGGSAGSLFDVGRGAGSGQASDGTGEWRHWGLEANEGLQRD
jgi:hypothetical protein